MLKDIMFSVIEMGFGIVVESVILGFIFQQMSNRAVKDNENILRQEMKTIESQNKFDYEQIQAEIRASKIDIISQIKESLE